MKIWEDLSQFNAERPVMTIGIFDGVHRGHHYLIDRLREKAAALRGETAVITLWPHPRVVLNKDPESLRYLTTLGEKKRLLADTGIDHLVIIPFTRAFSELHSCEFVEQYLVNKMHLHYLITGFNHKFGKDREGDYESLKKCAKALGFGMEKLGPVNIGGETVSSSMIRDLLSRGELEKANLLLGYDYFLQGEVVDGNKIGRTLGFPTANIRLHDSHKLIPADGVYAVRAEWQGKIFKGMLSVGLRPTITTGPPGRTIEVHIFGMDADLYGEDVTIYFLKRMRDEKKFDTIEQLKDQLVKDREMAIDLLGHLK